MAGKLRHSTCLVNYTPSGPVGSRLITKCQVSRNQTAVVNTISNNDHAPIRPVIQPDSPAIQSSSSQPSIHHQSKSPFPKASITGTITPLFTFNLALSFIRVYSTGQSKLTHGTSSAGAMPAHV